MRGGAASSTKPPARRPRHKRRALRRRRRAAAILTLLSPAGFILLGDLARRPHHLLSFDRLHIYAYLATAVASASFWAALLYAAAPRRHWYRQLAAGLFAALFTLAAGVQTAFYPIYGIYLSHDAQIYARSIPAALLGYLPLGWPSVALRLGLTLLVALGMLVAARSTLRPGRWGRRLAPLGAAAVLVGMSYLPASYRMWQSSTPDAIYFHGLGSLIKERTRRANAAPELRVQRRHPVAVPALQAEPARPRNVLFILQESLRADIVCSAYDPRARCATPFSNRAVPERHPLLQLRANAATTAISISNLWSGIGPHQSLETLLTVPLLWDYAAAAGYDGAYWTSQNVMFGSMRLYVQDLPVAHRVVATQLDSRADYDAGARDALLTDWVIAHWDELREPFFAVVHFSNVHFPYLYDAAHAPFQPAALDKSADKGEELFNYYQDVAYLSDMAVGRLLEHVRASDSGPRTVILYTADHGESFREHWQLGHTSSLYDEEIHVPGWIDAPEGTLSPAELRAVRGAREQLVWHYDFPPTMLDLMGLWDAPDLAPFRAAMIGKPITRPERTTRPVPLSNCAWLWECGFRNWGLMQGPLKIEARQWDDTFHCFDVLADPLERHDLGEAACAPLPAVARRIFGAMPVRPRTAGKDLLYGPAPPASGSASAR